MLSIANPVSGEKVLDLCCGTGDVSFAFAKRGADVVGYDFSASMLSVANQRLSASSGKKSCKGVVRFMEGDAQQLPFPDASFDIVTISYGLRNLADWKKGLAEMVRVCKPGGRLLVLDFGKPENRVLRGLYFWYLGYAVPVLGKLFCGDADTHGYILESLKNYAAQRGVELEMKERGMESTVVINLVGGAMSINYAKKPVQAGDK
jgi:demethylmenaquinone methyltransferase/2-methoxy-6-polyprenyl-1,4-benzoquinol methylase